MSSAFLQRFAIQHEYPVYFSDDVLSPQSADLADALAWREPARRHRVVVALDGNLAAAWPDLAARVAAYAGAHAGRMELVREPVLLPGGEAAKNQPALVGQLCDVMDAVGLDRQSFLVAAGGGAVLDLCGYAAATFHRGVRLVRVATTVLAQADSGVGVKNGINALGKKNLLGTFAPPWAVLCCRRLLGSLGAREQRSGMAEAIKVALIRDAAFFDWLDGTADALAACSPAEVWQLVQRSARHHLDHIAGGGDPFETGSARPLDFGHWAAHKLEVLSEHRLHHGEAVAVGMALDIVYSRLAGLLAETDAARALRLIRGLGLPTWDAELRAPALLDGVREFREHLGGELTVTMLAGIGRGVQVSEIDAARVRAAALELAP